MILVILPCARETADGLVRAGERADKLRVPGNRRRQRCGNEGAIAAPTANGSAMGPALRPISVHDPSPPVGDNENNEGRYYRNLSKSKIVASGYGVLQQQWS